MRNPPTAAVLKAAFKLASSGVLNFLATVSKEAYFLKSAPQSGFFASGVSGLVGVDGVCGVGVLNPYTVTAIKSTPAPKSTGTPSILTVAFDGAGGPRVGNNPEFNAFAKSIGAKLYDGTAGIASTGRDVSKAYSAIKEFYGSNPKGVINLMGYSAGGNDVIALANMLAKDNIQVNSLVTFDPHPRNRPGQGNYDAGSNVTTALNFYQRNSFEFGSNPFRGSQVDGARNINLTDSLTIQGVNHVNIFDYALANNRNDIFNALRVAAPNP